MSGEMYKNMTIKGMHTTMVSATINEATQKNGFKSGMVKKFSIIKISIPIIKNPPYKARKIELFALTLGVAVKYSK